VGQKVSNNLSSPPLCFAAATDAEALELARRQTPDLILLDLDTPEGDRAAICAGDKETQTTRYILPNPGGPVVRRKLFPSQASWRQDSRNHVYCRKTALNKTFIRP
jgi:hypothetical protein